MATSVYEAETLVLSDGTEIEMKPLKIAKLRKFMKEFTKLQSVSDDNDKTFDVLTNCVVMAIDQWKPELANKAFVEDNLDINNYYDVIKMASGIDMRTQGNL